MLAVLAALLIPSPMAGAWMMEPSQGASGAMSQIWTSAPTSTLPQRKSITLAASVVLQRGKSRLFRDGELLVYGGAVESVEGNPARGDLVDVTDGAGKPLAWGAYNPDSMFRVRLLWSASDGDIPLLENSKKGNGKDNNSAGRLKAVLRYRIKSAVAKRQRLGLPNEETTCYRLINAEGDRLSGLAVDVFDSTAVVSSGAVWCEKHRGAIEEAILTESDCGIENVLWEQSKPRLKQDGWIDVSPSEGKLEDGVDDVAEDAAGDFFSVETDSSTMDPSGSSENQESASPSEKIVFEQGLQYIVSLAASQKTGFYCDQRENRVIVRSLVRPGDRVLDLCSYSVNELELGRTLDHINQFTTCQCFMFSFFRSFCAYSCFNGQSVHIFAFHLARALPQSTLLCQGGFALNALKAGASYVIGVDSSPAAVDLAKRNAQLNGFDVAELKHGASAAAKATTPFAAFEQADIAAFMFKLREESKEEEKFDLIVLDPPKLAPNRKSLERATTK